MTTYLDSLHQAVGDWIKANPDDYKTLRAEVAASFRRAGKPDHTDKASFRQRTLNAAVVEAIRKRIGFPSERSHEAGERLPV